MCRHLHQECPLPKHSKHQGLEVEPQPQSPDTIFPDNQEPCEDSTRGIQVPVSGRPLKV